MKKILSLIMLSIIIISCKTQNNILKDINDLQKVYNKQDKKLKKSKILLGRKFNPTKIISNKLATKLNNNNFIYIFSWANTMPITNTHIFYALLHDLSTGKNYYVYNKQENKKNIIIKDKGNQYFIDHEYLLREYLKMGNLDDLVPFEHQANSAEIGTNYYLFDTQNKKVYNIQNIVFEEGKPVRYD
ncbi:hypothetical protein HZQ12_17520 [Elizabethkingia anophelis]|uniref:hypothetical protein n=1 Tax=Elizabethkingia anophelis TaxID=1117645 RepID=UPI0021A79421|nr:hypothetical protein [Elizabethkingia anophelis]MCT3978699.1 hypothetical protein [Elizabethkingia anophelis]MCT4042520.1 hypothetical protein [Elizabethkingia anophelis]MDV3865836.1 hypothetical protein [Elizabethkingia anophelis]